MEVQFGFTYEDPFNGTTTLFDLGGADGYKADFVIRIPTSTPPLATTTWIGGAATGPAGFPGGVNNWLNPNNWSNGVPNAQSDAIIPGPPRPNPPILNDPNANYAVRNLTIQVANPSSAATTRGILRVTTATLRIYGDISNGGNGILATTTDPNDPDPTIGSNSAIIVLAGGNQTIDRGRFANLIIQNNVVNSDGTITPGTVPVIKSNFGTIEIPGGITFAPNVKATVRSTVQTAGGDFVLSTSGDQLVELKSTGSISGETNTAFVLGVLKADRDVSQNNEETFGGIGIDITIRGSNTAGHGLITRITGTSFSPVTDVNGNPVGARSIKREFFNSFTGLQNGFNADVVFHYNNSTTNADGQDDELSTNRDGYLEIFRTTSGSTFTNLGGTNVKDPSIYPGNGGTVTVAGLNNINSLTLVDYATNPIPLPIVLAAFDAKRTNSDALITWATASEKNSKGFNVEVSTNGTYFRSLGFVASTAPNSSSAQNYRFVDAEAGKSGKRYYRLRQEDLDGKISLSPVKVVDFGVGGLQAATSTLLGYPNPFTSELNVSIAGAGSGNATLRLTDLAGRTIRTQQVSLDGGSSKLTLDNLGDLKAGTYIMQMTMPSGKTQTFKVQKQ